jgi:hypothetical protein
MTNWLRSWLLGLDSAAPPAALCRFGTADSTLTQDSIEVQGDSWLVDAKTNQVVRLFEVAAPDVEQCLLLYRATIKSENLTGRAFLEMWCRLPGRGEFFSRGLNQTVQGTTAWTSFEIPFRLKKGQRPDLIKLNLVVEGYGLIWIKGVELLKMRQ